MTDDIVAQLRDQDILCDEAADEIERLRAALMFYRDAWLVTTEGKIPFEPDDRLWDDKGEVARAALAGEKKDD